MLSMKSLAAALLLAAPLLMPAPAIAADEVKAMLRTLAVSATGTSTATPDQVSISTGVTSNAKTAKAALAANSAAMNKVVATMKATGVEERDIQTSNFSLQPVYDYSQNGKPPKLTGYQVSNTVTIRLRNIARLGDVLDQAVGDGSNQIGGIQFIVSKADQLRDAARKDAVANATRIAKTYAAAAGVTLGDVLQINEGAVVAPPNPMIMRQAKAQAESAAPPIEAGEETLTVNVSMVFALK